jgi:RNA polymerase sigma factor (TIGR02999 family)
MHEVTALLAQARGGDRAAGDRLFELVYRDLRQLAGRQLGRGNGALGATSLVHEAWFRLARPDAQVMNDRQHFFAVAARAMRQIAIDHVRAQKAGKRGGGQLAVSLDDIGPLPERQTASVDLVALDQALQRLGEVDPQLVQLVEMRFFAGLDLDEIAGLTDRSTRTLKRDWRKARAFLQVQLGAADDDDA